MGGESEEIMRIETGRNWDRAKLAAWHAIRCDDCRRKAQQLLATENPHVQNALLDQVEACMQRTRPVAL